MSKSVLIPWPELMREKHQHSLKASLLIEGISINYFLKHRTYPRMRIVFHTEEDLLAFTLIHGDHQDEIYKVLYDTTL